jgi:hypothetical protein
VHIHPFVLSRTTLPTAMIVATLACGPSGPDTEGSTPSDGGGTPVGGTPSGGTPSGGTPSGGTPSGGTPSGGTPSGGTPSGGTPSGGTPSGGTPSGGTPSGGTPSGGPPSGGTPTEPPPGANPGGGGGDGSGGGSGGLGETAWTKKMGGLGVEWTHDLAFAPDGTIVAFNLIGVRGERLEQIGFVHLDADGREFQSEFENEGNAALRFSSAGSFAIAPSGDFVLAATGICDERCPTIGGGSVDGGALVALNGRAELVWNRALPGEVLSNVAVDGAGNVLVASRSGRGAVLRKYTRDGALAWEQDGLELAPETPVALDGGGNAYYARGSTLLKHDAGGGGAWEQQLGGDARVTAVRGSGDGVVVVAVFRGALDLGGSHLTPPEGADQGHFLAAIGGDGAAQWARRIDGVQEVGEAGGVKTRLAIDRDGRIAVVTGADACTAAVYGYEPNGDLRWRRSLAANGCGGREIVVNGAAAAPGRIAVGGAISASVDFGTGPVSALATDGFVVGLRP